MTLEDMKRGIYSDIAKHRGWIRMRTDIGEIVDAMTAEEVAITVKEALRFIQPDSTETAEEVIERLPNGFSKAFFITMIS